MCLLMRASFPSWKVVHTPLLCTSCDPATVQTDHRNFGQIFTALERERKISASLQHTEALRHRKVKLSFQRVTKPGTKTRKPAFPGRQASAGKRRLLKAAPQAAFFTLNFTSQLVS